MIAARQFGPVDGILFDLGLSSFHLDASAMLLLHARRTADMRFDPTDDERAPPTFRRTRADELAAIFATTARSFARASPAPSSPVGAAADHTTGQLFAAIEQSLPPATRWRANRDAARIFQALRIAANDELEQVASVLPQAVAALAPAGRLAVIAFHSLEDRMVKHFLRDQAAAGRVRLLHRKPIIADEAEIAANPRAGSAKLRSAEKI